LHVGDCIEDKFLKNIAKYPADLVKGSAAKYTAYKEQLAEKKNAAAATVTVGPTQRNLMVTAMITTIFGALIGFAFGVRVSK
jgi:hypothetical protein